MDGLRQRVSQAIARNRTPGFHFVGHFLDIAFERVEPGTTIASMPVASHCADRAGIIEPAVLTLLADVALAAGIRAQLGRIGRLATVSIDLRFCTPQRGNRLDAAPHFEGVHAAGESEQMSSVVIRGSVGTVCFGAGTFMTLPSSTPVPEHPITRPADNFEPGSTELAEADLAETESVVVRRADEAIQASTANDVSFLSHFLGYRARGIPSGAIGEMRNELHVQNRYGHVQGGLLLGFAAATAKAALPSRWTLSGLSASFTRVADSDVLTANSTVLHAGRRTSVVRTQITAPDGSGVLEALTTHAAMAA